MPSDWIECIRAGTGEKFSVRVSAIQAVGIQSDNQAQIYMGSEDYFIVTPGYSKIMAMIHKAEADHEDF